MISRTHPGLIKRLFEMHTPEIKDGTVEIMAVSREAGSRTKIAVWSKDENVDAVGACIGPKGSRVSAIVEELGGEKIDVIKYSENPEELVAEALSPAEVVGVLVDPTGAKTQSYRTGQPAFACNRQQGTERPSGSPFDRLEDRHRSTESGAGDCRAA